MTAPISRFAHSLSRYALVALACFPLSTSAARAENWPGWRGPRGDGTSFERNVPTRWSETDNVTWKVPVPGSGHASPIVWEDRIFVASCREDAQERILLCFDRVSGQMLWQQVVLRSPLEEKHQLNSFASSTPATDGQLVYVTFLDQQQMVVAAYDFEGRKHWMVRPGEFSSKHGYCSCPVLFEDKVIVNGDHDGDAYLVALDRASGKTIWKVSRENKTRSYSTPLIREIDGRTQMILSGSKCVASYDPHDGKQHWIIDGPTEQFVASMVYDGRLLFLTAGFPELHMMAIRPDGHGNVTDTHIAWRTKRGASYVPSPIAEGDYFLVVSDGGVASCFEAATGERTWMERLGTHYSSSPVSSGGKIYFTSDEGKTTVIRPGPKLNVVAENMLGEACFASPAISHGQLFFRGTEHLMCIGKPAESQGTSARASN
jgi:outer membrane protein assembly factor BamB